MDPTRHVSDTDAATPMEVDAPTLAPVSGNPPKSSQEDVDSQSVPAAAEKEPIAGTSIESTPSKKRKISDKLDERDAPVVTCEYGCYCGSLHPPERTVDSIPIAISPLTELPVIRLYGRLPLLQLEGCAPVDEMKRIFSRADVRCEKCGLFFHICCLRMKESTSLPLPGDNGYVFCCRRCASLAPSMSDPVEYSHIYDDIKLADRPWMDSLRVVFYNLRLAHEDRQYFHIKEEIVPFIEKHWEILCLARSRGTTWPNTITSTMSINHDIYRNGNSQIGGSGWWGLIIYDNPLLLRLSLLLKAGAVDRSHPHRAVGSHLDKAHTMLSADALAKKLKKTSSRQDTVVAPIQPAPTPPVRPSEPAPAQPLSSTIPAIKRKNVGPPSSHATELAPAPTALLPHVPQPLLHTALPIVPYMVPIVPSPANYTPPPASSSAVMQMVRENSAEQIWIDKTGLNIRNGKGYCTARGSFPALEGAWYYEATVYVADPKDWSHLMDKTNREWPKPPHWRLGWAAAKSDVQTPPGSDSFSYSWRDLDGSVFHQGRHMPYSSPFQPSDVLGFYIELPKRPIASDSVHSGRIIFFKNGVCEGGVAFEGLWGCKPDDPIESFSGFYPAVSAYYNGCVSVRFGPDFQFPLQSGGDLGISPDWQPCSRLPEAYYRYRELHFPPPPPPPVSVESSLVDPIAPSSSAPVDTVKTETQISTVSPEAKLPEAQPALLLSAPALVYSDERAAQSTTDVSPDAAVQSDETKPAEPEPADVVLTGN